MRRSPPTTHEAIQMCCEVGGLRGCLSTRGAAAARELPPTRSQLLGDEAILASLPFSVPVDLERHSESRQSCAIKSAVWNFDRPFARGFLFSTRVGVTRVSMEVAGCWGCCNPRTAHTATQDSNSGSPSPQGSPNMPPWGLGRPLGHCRGAGDGQTVPWEFRLSAGCSVDLLKPAAK